MNTKTLYGITSSVFNLDIAITLTCEVVSLTILLIRELHTHDHWFDRSIWLDLGSSWWYWNPWDYGITGDSKRVPWIFRTINSSYYRDLLRIEFTQSDMVYPFHSASTFSPVAPRHWTLRTTVRSVFSFKEARCASPQGWAMTMGTVVRSFGKVNTK